MAPRFFGRRFFGCSDRGTVVIKEVCVARQVLGPCCRGQETQPEYLVRRNVSQVRSSWRRVLGRRLWPLLTCFVYEAKISCFNILALRGRMANFDATLGYPGEGPKAGPPTQGQPKYKDICIRTSNVTDWSTFKRCFEEDDFGQCDVICLQEHKLWDGQRIEQAKRWASIKGYSASFTKARRTPKGGASSGTAIL